MQPHTKASYYRLLSANNLGLTGIKEGSAKMPEVIWDRFKIEALAFEGGGTKGVVYGGALKRLEEANLLQDIKNFAGTSAGAQTAAIAAFGYTAQETIDVLASAPWNKLLDDQFGCLRDLWRLNTQYGFYKGEFLQEYLDNLFEAKSGKKKCTLRELYDLRGVHLKVGVISVTEQNFQLIDYLTEPDIPVSLAVRASSALPGVFTVVKWKDKVFVDGGLLGNLPANAFPGKKTLALDLVSKEDTEYEVTKRVNLPSGLLDHFGRLSTMVINHAQIMRRHKMVADMREANHAFHTSSRLFGRKPAARMLDIIKIPTGDAPVLDSDLDKVVIEQMVASGWVAIDKYLTGSLRDAKSKRSWKNGITMVPPNSDF
mmetsp:Transcript_18519/g.54132  ORF Transcript_18519/g.54132 Transcript_18519/m.54132 type:complete len:371 (+) Transcript_18519:45-1157(+)|eukprot:CAMPEP_0206042904 /NCGR_PEP_ID=MMETSP1466-20131121/7063_1 /ASSEMBLY_ACC=CAM_ASM_001126 /TAXON_ID=44452 /ORGANISM="Pavlova gyrans, Strain CCMP608" /LENGTH=370 /DNA_ID=CAMNT_0053417637 /DNA_START=43 /DNA_END=1155 /DNA_ORIENTATION=-